MVAVLEKHFKTFKWIITQNSRKGTYIWQSIEQHRTLSIHLCSLYIWRNWSLGKELALEPSSMLLKSDVTPSPLTESPFSQFSCSVPMDWTMPGLPVHHQLPEPTQTHAHWVNDAIQPSHPLSSPSPPTFNLSQHKSLFQWVSS